MIRGVRSSGVTCYVAINERGIALPTMGDSPVVRRALAVFGPYGAWRYAVTEANLWNKLRVDWYRECP